MPGATPWGTEFLVNTATDGAQSAPTVIALANGQFVVAWEDGLGAGDPEGIRAQIFNADGSAASAAFLVNTTVANAQNAPVITALDDGHFVVAWVDSSQSGGDISSTAVRAQVFNVDGTKSGPEILVNTTTANAQSQPTITALADGNFAVAWQDLSQTGGDLSNSAVRGQVFNANGTPLGTEFLANTTTDNVQGDPTIIGLTGGRFVVAWSDSSQSGGDTSSFAVRAQIFNADGTPFGSEFLANTTTTGVQFAPRAVALSDGRFVLTWVDGDELIGQIFDAVGTKSGGEFAINTLVPGIQWQQEATALTDGRFVVTWADFSGAVGDPAWGINAQVFNADGTKSGSVFRVNTTTASVQQLPSISALADGRFVVTWKDASTGTGDDIKAQIFDPREAAVDVDGSALDDDFIGTGFDDILSGFGGNDRLDGAGGADELTGGAGDDTYFVDDAGDVVSENAGEGIDTVYSSITYALTANVENLVLTGATIIDGTGNELANTITGNGTDNVLDGGAGIDTLIGGLGEDTYYVDDVGDVVVENQNEGNDYVYSTLDYTLGSDVEALELLGTAIQGDGNALNNYLVGNGEANILNGAAGNDTLIGGAGIDTMTGGTGDDAYHVDNSGDIVVEDPVGGGHDKVYASASYTLAANVEDLFLVELVALTGTGNDLDNLITGNLLANILDGGIGNDTLDGSGAGDTMIGGVGDDTYVVQSAADVVVENAGEGADTVKSAISHTLAANVETLILTGTALNGTGNELDNTLVGNALANVLDGGLGADTMGGGAGSDTYIVDDAGDVVVEKAVPGVPGGTDKVIASITYALGDNVENLVLTGIAAIDGTGNWQNNTLTGNIAGNILDGSLGADAMAGGAGGDSYVVDNAGDVVTEIAGEGSDTVFASISYTLGAHVENLILTGSATSGIGNALANALTGNTAANTLDGGSGADGMSGGAGGDTYIVDNAGDAATENAGEGNDTVVTSVSFALGAHIETLVLTGLAAIDGTGNDLDNTLTGNGAANRLDGGLGADAMAGGAGGDTYVVDNAGDATTENAGEGSDAVIATISHTLAANVEDLFLAAGAVDGTGNDLDNTITGNASANRIHGGGGADAMAGGDGDDVYFVDDAGDAVTEQAGEGADTVRSTVSFALSAAVESLALTGAAAVDATGNGLNNAITGNDAANLIDGRGGADLMAGGLGDDSYVVDDAGDVLVEGAGEGTDSVVSAVAFTLGAEFENLTLTGSAGATAKASLTGVNGTGNALANSITGSDAGNRLDGGLGNDDLKGEAGLDSLLGGAGNDRLAGGLGKDTLTGGNGRDSFLFDAALKSNVDKIADFSVPRDTIVLDDAIFAKLKVGHLSASAFFEGNAAHDATDRIIYDADSGALFYDKNGAQAGGMVKFATLAADLDVTQRDFLVI